MYIEGLGVQKDGRRGGGVGGRMEDEREKEEGQQIVGTEGGRGERAWEWGEVEEEGGL